MQDTATSAVTAGLAAALALVLLVVGFKVLVTPAWPADDLIPQNLTPTINRALKGDRLASNRTNDLARSPVRKLSGTAQKLPEGCEPVVSPVAASPLSRIARTCQS
jgi:hypothetical protein